jgi:hypothetical protein
MSEANDFTVHHLRFEVEALMPLLLPAHAGPSIRGALFGALQRHFCPAPAGEVTAEHKAICPVCWLMATEKPQARRGRDVPRPYTVEPPVVSAGVPSAVEPPASPLPGGGACPEREPEVRSRRDRGGAWRFQPGQRFTFGLTLFGQALNLFPYLVVAMPIMGQTGLGIPLRENAAPSGQKRRGQFALRRIEAVNPLTGESAPVMGEGQTTVQMPDLPVRAPDIAAVSRTMLARPGIDGRVQIHFHTPTRIVEAGRLAHRPWLGPLFRRLLERLDALRAEFAGQPPLPDRERLTALADTVRLTHDFTRWVEIKSGSRRLGRSTPVSGFMGTAAYQADAETWRQLLPHLLWGQVTHVGKNATKGGGWYEVRVSESAEEG